MNSFFGLLNKLVKKNVLYNSRTILTKLLAFHNILIFKKEKYSIEMFTVCISLFHYYKIREEV